MDKPNHLVPVSQDQDGERFRELLVNPAGSAHLFTLLSSGKGTEDDLRRMIDRINASRVAAAQPGDGGEG
jgi:hypothetical protein